ncbi:MAG: hypothetical protein HEQ39_15955 [Rhizobacter sp.]
MHKEAVSNMNLFEKYSARFARAAFVLLLGLGAAAIAMAQSDGLRPEVGKPLQAAQELIKSQRFKEALAKVRDADAVNGKSANEVYMVERMRLAAASGLGDVETASRSFEAAQAIGRLSATDRQRMLESLAISAYRAKDYARALSFGQRYVKDGGSSASVRAVLIQSQYLTGDYAGTVRELQQELQATEKAGGIPTEERLTLLLNAAQRLNDPGVLVAALEKLVAYYPKKAYWADLISRVQRKPSYSDRLALDAYRLQLATGGMATANDFMEMAQLAVQAGLPAEAVKVVERGFAERLLGVGDQAPRHQRLRELVLKRAQEAQDQFTAQEAEAAGAKEGDALVILGLNQVFAGQHVKGLALMQQGMKKPKLKRPQDVSLHWAVALVTAGQVSQAQSQLKTVGGAEGQADLARLWLLHLRRKN